MNEKMERVKKRVDEIKKERDELKGKYDYLVEQMKKAIDKHSQDIEFLSKEVKGIAGKEGKEELGISDVRSMLNSLEKRIAATESKQSIVKEKFKEEVELAGRKLDSDISERMKIIQNRLVGDLKVEIDKSLEGVESLMKDVKKLQDRDEKYEEKISSIRSAVGSLGKSVTSIEDKQTALKGKIGEEIGIIKDNLDSDIHERMRTIRGRVAEDFRKEIDKGIAGLSGLKDEIAGFRERYGKCEEKISNLQSLTNSVSKSLAGLENRYSVMKEKMDDEMKLMSREIDSRLLEKTRLMNSSLRNRLKEMMGKNIEGIRSVKEDMNKIIKRNEEYEDKFLDVSEGINSIKKSISELGGKQDALKDELYERVNLLEKEINSEILKIKGLEERLGKNMENFEKLAVDQKSKTEKFESRISGKMDMFAVEMGNARRDFSSISNDFKNIGSRLDSLRERDSDLNQRLQNMEIDVENFKKVTEEMLGKLQEDRTIFKENLVARLNETNDKILSRLSQDELETSSKFAKQSEEIKLFRAHLTQFVNELVSNYEKRFEMMKGEIDQALRLLEEKAKEQRAMIFE